MPEIELRSFWAELDLADAPGAARDWRKRDRLTARERSMAEKFGKVLHKARQRRQALNKKEFSREALADFLTRKTGERWTGDTVVRLEEGRFLPNALELWLLRWRLQVDICDEMDLVLVGPAQAPGQNWRGTYRELQDLFGILTRRMMRDPAFGELLTIQLRAFMAIHAKAFDLYDLEGPNHQVCLCYDGGTVEHCRCRKFYTGSGDKAVDEEVPTAEPRTSTDNARE